MATLATDKFIEQLRRAVLCGGHLSVTDARQKLRQLHQEAAPRYLLPRSIAD